MEFLLYASESSETGPRLGDYLGVESGTNMPDERYDHLVRWGSTRRVAYVPRDFTLNTRSSLLKGTNKLESLVTMRSAGVPVPDFSRSLDEVGLPALGRCLHHMEGRDIGLILQPVDVDMGSGSYDFYTEYVPKRYEFRVHVFDSQIIKVSQKKYRPEEDDEEYSPECWNYGNGWRFCNPDIHPPGLQQAIPAVNAHGMDFGAVDVIITEEGRPVVLEVNSAPSCGPNTLPVYGNLIAEKLHLEDIPGMEAVEFEEDEGDENA